MRHAILAVGLLGLAPLALPAAAPPPAVDRVGLARQALAVLQKNCYRCHGKDGAVEGGLNHILDRDRLVARRKVVPGQPDKSPLFVRSVKGRMPPVGEKPRPSAAELAVLRRWIEAGAPAIPALPPALLPESAVLESVLADLERMDRRSRRFVRYFSLAPLANAGHSADELTTYRNALAKLLNSLSWHPRITIPQAIGPGGLVLRIDLRDYQWDANLWNRLLTDYPYGILHDTGVARAVLVATGTRVPVVRADWFVATASRAPLYYDLLQIPANLAELERQLRVDVGANIQQERVARAGFNGSGISKNNRILERHDSLTGAYWRSYDFEAVPQNLLERSLLAPDRRNVFAYPLGPGLGENGFQHAGGEIIFNLPNGLQAYVLVNANNQRINKGPIEIVSDAKRPDRAVEAGVSCIHCHSRGIIVKDDMLREHVGKNRKAFSRQDVETVEALYPPAAKMRRLMAQDAERFRRAVEKTGNKVDAAEVVMAMTLRHEADVDLPTLAAELGVRPADLLPRLRATESLTRNLGALRVPGAVVPRQVVVQTFGDLVRELKLGTAFDTGRAGESLPDATGDVDPLEAQSSPANAMAFSPDGKLAAFASADKSVRIYDIDAGRDLRRCIGHTASVWCVAFSADGKRLISGGKDGTLRVWDVETARELTKIDAHLDLVSAVAFSPDGRRALSAGYDHEVSLWDVDRGTRVAGFAASARYAHHIAFSPDGRSAVVASGPAARLIDARTGKLLRLLQGHSAWLAQAAFSRDGRRLLTASDDGTARLWDAATGKRLADFNGHVGPVKAVALSPDGRHVVTGGGDATVRLWTVAGKELRVFRKHTESLVAVAFGRGGRETLSGSRDAVVHPWDISKLVGPPPPTVGTTTPPVGTTEGPALKPAAVVRVGGTIGRLLVSQHHGSLYYLNLSDNVVGRVGLRSLRLEKSRQQATGVTALAISPDGKALVGLYSLPRGKFASSNLQVIHPETLEPRLLLVPRRSYDLAVGDDGRAFLSGGGPEWTDVAEVDLRSGKVLQTWGNIWGRSFVQLTPNGRRLYVSSQGVIPGTLDAFNVLPNRTGVPAARRAPNHERQRLGGEFSISPDGKYLLCKTGDVLKLADDAEEDMQPHARIDAFLSMAIDVAGGAAYAIDPEGALRVYSYPDFRPLARRRLALAGYEVAVDPAGGRLFVAGFDPRSVVERPRAAGHGDIHVYALKGLAGDR